MSELYGKVLLALWSVVWELFLAAVGTGCSTLVLTLCSQGLLLTDCLILCRVFSGRKLKFKREGTWLHAEVKAMDLNGIEDGRSKLGSELQNKKGEHCVEMYSKYYALCVLESSVCCMTEIKHIWPLKTVVTWHKQSSSGRNSSVLKIHLSSPLWNSLNIESQV